MSKIYTIHRQPSDSGDIQLAIVGRPRGNEWLFEDLKSLSNEGIDVLISFLEPHEVSELGLKEEFSVAEAVGIRYLNYPIPDRQTPDSFMDAKAFIQSVSQLLQQGNSVGVHCRQSVGRSGFMSAAILVEMDWDADSAFSAIQKARGCPVPDTTEQREWVEKYAGLQEFPLFV